MQSSTEQDFLHAKHWEKLLAQHLIKELKPKHPVFAAIIERGHQMDLRETLGALIVVEALKFFRIHAARLATD